MEDDRHFWEAGVADGGVDGRGSEDPFQDHVRYHRRDLHRGRGDLGRPEIGIPVHGVEGTGAAEGFQSCAALVLEILDRLSGNFGRGMALRQRNREGTRGYRVVAASCW